MNLFECSIKSEEKIRKQWFFAAVCSLILCPLIVFVGLIILSGWAQIPKEALYPKCTEKHGPSGP